ATAPIHGNPMAIRPACVFESIMYEYAKLIADSVVYQRADTKPTPRQGSRYWSFVSSTFTKLTHSEIAASTILRENKLLVVRGQQCAYCAAASTPLHWEHVVPRSRGGPESIDNLVLSCARCNAEKA